MLTDLGLAERAGVASMTVFLVDHGRSVLRFEIIQTLSAALGIEPKEIAEFTQLIPEVGQGKVPTAVAV